MAILFPKTLIDRSKKSQPANFLLKSLPAMPRVPSQLWRELKKRIWEVDPLSSPRCGYEMEIISVIHEPDLIALILPHLRLWKQPRALS